MAIMADSPLLIDLGGSPVKSERPQDFQHDAEATSSSVRGSLECTPSCTIAIAVKAHDRMRMECFAYVFDHLVQRRTFDEKQGKLQVVVICCLSRVRNEFGVETILDPAKLFGGISKEALEDAIRLHRNSLNRFLAVFREKLIGRRVELDIHISIGRSSMDILCDAAQALHPLWVVIDWPETRRDWASWSDQEKRDFQAGLWWNLVLLEKNSIPLVIPRIVLQRTQQYWTLDPPVRHWTPTSSPVCSTGSRPWTAGQAYGRSPLMPITPSSPSCVIPTRQSNQRSTQSKQFTMYTPGRSADQTYGRSPLAPMTPSSSDSLTWAGSGSPSTGQSNQRSQSKQITLHTSSTGTPTAGRGYRLRSPLQPLTPSSSGSAASSSGQSNQRSQLKENTSMHSSGPGCSSTSQEYGRSPLRPLTPSASGTSVASRIQEYQSLFQSPVSYEAALAMAIEASIFSGAKEGVYPSTQNSSFWDGGGNSSFWDGGGGGGTREQSAKINPIQVNCICAAGCTTAIVNKHKDKQKAEDKSDGRCVICLDAPADAVCIPCGHLVGCKDCLTQTKAKKWGCPVCRAKIQQVIKVYTA
ncbi:unnamed protein product [Calypogeia fissa]